MNFSNFLESLAASSGEEAAFIRKFFQGFLSFMNYDKITLGVFADWLEDRGDPRSELLRRTLSQGSVGEEMLGNEMGREYLAKKLNIKHTVQALPGIADDDLPSRNWDILSSVDPDIFLMFGKITPPTWVSRNAGIIQLNKVSNQVLSEYFWDLMGYGWSLF